MPEIALKSCLRALSAPDQLVAVTINGSHPATATGIIEAMHAAELLEAALIEVHAHAFEPTVWLEASGKRMCMKDIHREANFLNMILLTPPSDFVSDVLGEPEVKLEDFGRQLLEAYF